MILKSKLELHNDSNPAVVQQRKESEMNKAYEIHNPSFSDMNLEAQIEVGINDWVVEGKSGHLYFGQTANEAIAIATSYDFK
jgi:hypothetical protein